MKKESHFQVREMEELRFLIEIGKAGERTDLKEPLPKLAKLDTLTPSQ